MARTDDTTAYAANWRMVLAADAALGLIVSIAGVVVAVIASLVAGLALIGAGALYSALVAVRARRWARLRRETGL